MSLAVAKLATVEWHFDRAANDFLRIARRESLATPEQKAYALAQAGLCYHADGRTSQQVDCYRRILDDYPSSASAPKALLCLGVAQYVGLKKSVLALDSWAEVVRRYPASPESNTALLYMGLLHYREGRIAEAKKPWLELERRDPGFPWEKTIKERYLSQLDAVIPAVPEPKPKRK